MEQAVGGPLDEVGMRGHVHQPAGRHARHLFIIFPVAGIGGLPAVGPGVGTRHREEPHIMQGADHIAERPAGKETAHMPGVVGQPVQLHPQQGQRSVFPLQLPLPQGLHVPDEVPEIAGERRHIQLTGIFLRQGGMLAQAEKIQSGRGSGLVHLGGAVVSVGRVGVGMQVCQHRVSSGGHLMPERGRTQGERPSSLDDRLQDTTPRRSLCRMIICYGSQDHPMMPGNAPSILLTKYKELLSRM